MASLTHVLPEHFSSLQAANAQSELTALNLEMEAAGPALKAAAQAEQEASSSFADLAMPLLKDSAAVLRSCEAAIEHMAAVNPALRALDFVMPDLKLVVSQVRQTLCLAKLSSSQPLYWKKVSKNEGLITCRSPDTIHSCCMPWHVLDFK